MKALARRLQALEGGQDWTYDYLSDAEIIDRMNELTLQLRPYGFDFPLLDGGPDDAERLRVTQSMMARLGGQYDGVHQATH